MSNITTTFTSLLSTVDTTASVITNTIGTVGRSVSMLDRYVAEQQKKQAIRIAIDSTTYEEEMLTKAAERIAKEEVRVQKELDSNPEYKTKYQDIYSKLKAAIDKN